MESEEHPSRTDNLMVAAVIVSLMALVASVIAVGFASRGNTTTKSATQTANLTTEVTLSEFAISPNKITVAQGGSLKVTNGGKIAHTFLVKDKDIKTDAIDPGASTTVSMGDLPEGNYTVFCDVPGHEASGMQASLSVVAGSGAATDHSEHEGHDTKAMSSDEMDEIMARTTKQYVDAVTSGKPLTKGVGAQPLAPKILSDGTKQFELTAKITDWEVSPGKKVKAWSYNGVVPGPAIKVNTGDKVAVVLHNKLPESTTIHFHGIQDTPNSVDGVPDITQPPIKPGKTYTYTFTAPTQSVGMYHSHYDAQKQVVNGLLGPFIVGDVPTPNGVKPTQEIPMVLNDAGTIGLSLNGKSFPATAPIVAKQGEWIEIHYMNEGLQIHPMHTHGFQQWVIARDGTKLDSPYYADTVTVAPGERYTVLVHVTHPGVWAFHCHILNHAEGADGMFGMVTAIIVK